MSQQFWHESYCQTLVKGNDIQNQPFNHAVVLKKFIFDENEQQWILTVRNSLKGETKISIINLNLIVGQKIFGREQSGEDTIKCCLTNHTNQWNLADPLCYLIELSQPMLIETRQPKSLDLRLLFGLESVNDLYFN